MSDEQAIEAVPFAVAHGQEHPAKGLKAKEWPDQPMEGWKERGAEEP